MIVRQLLPSDADDYARLRMEMLHDSPWAFAASPESDVGVDPVCFAARLAEPGQALIGALADGESGPRLVGAAGLVRHRHPKMAHRALIWGVYVTPAERGRGVAGRIMDRVLEVARSWEGVTSVALSVSERSHGAQRLYERLGFVAWGREPGALLLDGRAYDEIHMIKDLRG